MSQHIVLLNEELPLTDDKILLDIYRKNNEYRKDTILIEHIKTLPEHIQSKFAIVNCSADVNKLWIISDENGKEHLEYDN